MVEPIYRVVSGLVHDPERLSAVLGGTGFEWLREKLRRALEKGELPKRATRREPSNDETRAFARLMGTTARVLSVDVAALERRLVDAGIADSLAAALVDLGGPIRDRRAERHRQSRAWSSLDAVIESDGRAWITSWYSTLQAEGTLARLAREPGHARELVDQCRALADRFPAGGVTLPVLAAEIAGDAHALDRGCVLGTLGVRLAAAFGGAPGWKNADAWREAWACAGVLEDQVSQPVLTLAVRTHGDGLSDRMLALHAEHGEVCPLTLAHLVRHPLTLDGLRGQHVFVCENPAILTSAVRANRKRPLVCTSGFPRAATRMLLRALSRAGAALIVQADFDASGLHIASKTLTLAGARPWRMDHSTYQNATAGPPLDDRQPLPPTPWDPELRLAMLERGSGVHEESILDSLLSDLG